MITNFLYGRGDLNAAAGGIPTVKRGHSLTFLNLDDAQTIWHTITACKAPCNKTTGIAYPLANGKADFDSGELGTGPVGLSPVTGKVRWKTPKSLRVGHLHVLLPDPPVHARGVPGRALVDRVVRGERRARARRRRRDRRRTA